MELRLLRAVYAMEFLIALIATFQFWGQVGGQSHIELMPWWLKAGVSLSIATCVVKLTMASGRRQLFIWAATLVFLLFSAGLITYYFHLYEPQDDPGDEDQVTPTAMVGSAPSAKKVLAGASCFDDASLNGHRHRCRAGAKSPYPRGSAREGSRSFWRPQAELEHEPAG